MSVLKVCTINFPFTFDIPQSYLFISPLYMLNNLCKLVIKNLVVCVKMNFYYQFDCLLELESTFYYS